MSIPQFTVVPHSVLRPETFPADIDQMLSEFPAFIAALNAVGSAFGVSLVSNSITELTIGVGTKNLTVGLNESFAPGMEVIIAFTTTPTIRMVGTVVSYNPATGALVVEVTSIGGAGTYSVWTICPTTIADFDGQAFTSLILGGSVTETPYDLAGGTDINPANGTIQYDTLGANRTFTSSIAVGQTVTLILTKGAWTAGWPAMDWVYGDPTLSSAYPSAIVLFNVTGTLCGIYCGPLQ
ncbi:MAG TPA: hypothetical protein VLK85_20050 [Ramlibacter sp.]|nr:hypothetical protein [Ramlibacter sp.]